MRRWDAVAMATGGKKRGERERLWVSVLGTIPVPWGRGMQRRGAESPSSLLLHQPGWPSPCYTFTPMGAIPTEAGSKQGEG